MEGGGVRGGERRLRQLHHSKIILCSVVDPDPHWLLCCSRSEIQIRIGNADPAPGAWSLTKLTNKTVFLFLKKAS
jgi:hypothetical protein